MHVAYPNPHARIADFGLSARAAEGWDWRRLVLHAAIHAHDKHLAQNCVAYVSLAGSLTVPTGLRRVRVSRPMLGFVLLLGGAAMGVLATLADIDNRNAEFRQQYGFGNWLLEGIAGGLHSAVAKSTTYCGGSAAITAFLGFRAFADRNIVTTAACLSAILSDVAAVVRPESQPHFSLIGGSGVAHAAHLGGFVFGALVAALDRALERSARQPSAWRPAAQQRPRFHGGGQPLGTS